MVEFAICVPVFLLFVFGIIQTVQIYRTQLALNQAASDAAQILAAQSSDGPPIGVNNQTDAPGLARVRLALATLNLNNLSGQCSNGVAPTYNSTSHVQSCANGSSTSGIDIFSDDGTGNPKSWPVLNSANLNSTTGGALPSAITIGLDNHYVAAVNSGTCPTDLDNNGNYQFSLTNDLHNTTNPIPSSEILAGTLPTGYSFDSCALPWNGEPFDNASTTGNQNGRHNQRCDEEKVTVKIRYNYISSAFPIHWGVQLVSSATFTIEPREFLGNSASQQSQVGTC